ncbi:hypothetical protein PENTCL1PPCAC_8288, partial [Pristionchus entomophagus]
GVSAALSAMPMAASASSIEKKARSTKSSKRKLDISDLEESRDYNLKTEEEKAADPDYDKKRKKNNTAVKLCRLKQKIAKKEEDERNVELLQRLHYAQKLLKMHPEIAHDPEEFGLGLGLGLGLAAGEIPFRLQLFRFGLEGFWL